MAVTSSHAPTMTSGDAADATTAAPPGAADTGIYRTAQDRSRVVERYDGLVAAWPIDCRHLDLATTTASVHVLDSGPLDGPPVVLLHAASMAATSWAPNVAALADAGFRTLAVDHPGEANRSVLTTRDDYPRSDAEVAELYREVLDALSLDRCALVGASAGAQRALRFTLAYPERVDRLALVGPMGLTPLRPSAIVRMMRAATSPSDERLDATARWALGPSPRIPDRYRDWFTCAMAAVAPPPPVARPTSTPTRLLRSIAAPTLVVLGNDDHLAGPARRVASRAAQLPDVTIRVLSSSHLVNIERAPVVNSLLVDHLSRKAASSARTRSF